MRHSSFREYRKDKLHWDNDSLNPSLQDKKKIPNKMGIMFLI